MPWETRLICDGEDELLLVQRRHLEAVQDALWSLVQTALRNGPTASDSLLFLTKMPPLEFSDRAVHLSGSDWQRRGNLVALAVDV